VATSTSLGRADVVNGPDEPTPPPSSADAERGFRVDPLLDSFRAAVVTPLAGAEILDVLTIGDLTATTGEVAVDVVVGGNEAWWYVTWSSGTEGSVGGGTDHDVSFEEWALETHREQPDADFGAMVVPQQLVDVDQYGAYMLRPGVELVREIQNPIANLEAPYTSAGLELRRGERHEYVVASPGSDMQTADPRELTLEQLIQRVRDATTVQYLSGPLPEDSWDYAGDHPPSFDGDIEVLRTIENPLGVEPPRRSVAYVLQRGDETWWAAWEAGPSGLQAAMTSLRAGDGYTSIEDWLADVHVRTDW
jgi:hypothetical protein